MRETREAGQEQFEATGTEETLARQEGCADAQLAELFPAFVQK